MFEVLNDIGVICDEEKMEGDIDLRDYIIDSVLFIGFIVEIENKFNIELDDNFLLYDNLRSMNGFIQMIEEFVKDSQNE